MKSCPSCENSSTTYTRCNPPVSTNCVFYQGDTKTCPHDDSFTICKGSNINDVQYAFFEKICEISGKIDVTDINFPCYEPWLIKTDAQKTLNALLVDTTTKLCQNDTAITVIQTSLPTLDPLVAAPCLPCCASQTCSNSSGTVLLSEALKQLEECICSAKTQASASAIAANNATETANQAKSQLDNPNTGLEALWIDYLKLKNNVLCRLSNLENKTTIICPAYP
jgi:hypothetical protein